MSLILPMLLNNYMIILPLSIVVAYFVYRNYSETYSTIDNEILLIKKKCKELNLNSDKIEIYLKNYKGDHYYHLKRIIDVLNKNHCLACVKTQDVILLIAFWSGVFVFSLTLTFHVIWFILFFVLDTFFNVKFFVNDYVTNLESLDIYLYIYLLIFTYIFYNYHKPIKNIGRLSEEDEKRLGDFEMQEYSKTIRYCNIALADFRLIENLRKSSSNSP